MAARPLDPVLDTLKARHFDREVAPGGWGPEDWSRATAAALAERLGPALAEAAHATGADLPRPCWATLTAARLENERWVARYERLLAEAEDVLAGQGIPVLVLKGLAQARHYPDPTVREAADVDLLVPPARMGAADRSLRDRGFSRSSPLRDGAARERYAVIYRWTDPTGETVLLEVHPRWHEIELGPDGEEVRIGDRVDRVARAEVAGATRRTLPPAPELYLAAAHAVLHTPRTLSVYLDVAILLERHGGEAAVRAVERLARANGRDRHVRHAVSAAADLFGLTTPSALRSTPSRLGVPLAWRLGCLPAGRRYLPSPLVLELLWRRGLGRRMRFAAWVLGHGRTGVSGTGAEAPGLGPLGRLRRLVRGLHWLRGVTLRYRMPASLRPGSSDL